MFVYPQSETNSHFSYYSDHRAVLWDIWATSTVASEASNDSETPKTHFSKLLFVPSYSIAFPWSMKTAIFGVQFSHAVSLKKHCSDIYRHLLLIASVRRLSRNNLRPLAVSRATFQPKCFRCNTQGNWVLAQLILFDWGATRFQQLRNNRGNLLTSCLQPTVGFMTANVFLNLLKSWSFFFLFLLSCTGPTTTHTHILCFVFLQQEDKSRLLKDAPEAKRVWDRATQKL